MTPDATALTPVKVSVTPTTEELLNDIRATMNFFVPRETVGRSTGRIAGWYTTEQTYQW